MLFPVPPAIVAPAEQFTALAPFAPSAADVLEMDLAHTATHPAVARLIAAATEVVEGEGQYGEDLRDLWIAIAAFLPAKSSTAATAPAATSAAPATGTGEVDCGGF